MKGYLFLISVILLGACKSTFKSTTEEAVFVSERKYPARVKQVEVDPLGSVYLLDKINKLTRYNTINNTKTEYVDNRLGNIDDFDTRNPLNIMVFFRQYSIVKFLDNTLSPIKVIALQENESFQNVSAACTTNDNKLWVFEENQQRFYKVDDNLQVIAETNRLSDLGLQKIQVVKMRENNNKLVVLIKNEGLFVFDNFGQFQKKIKTDLYTDFQFLEDNIIQFENCHANVIPISNPLQLQQSDELCTMNSGAKSARKLKQGWLLSYEDGVDYLFK